MIVEGSHAHLTVPMQRALQFMREHQDRLIRLPGGFWKAPEHERTFPTVTVQGLVSRGLAEYTEWKDGRNGRFPIAVVLVERKEWS